MVFGWWQVGKGDDGSVRGSVDFVVMVRVFLWVWVAHRR